MTVLRQKSLAPLAMMLVCLIMSPLQAQQPPRLADPFADMPTADMPTVRQKAHVQQLIGRALNLAADLERLERFFAGEHSPQLLDEARANLRRLLRQADDSFGSLRLRSDDDPAATQNSHTRFFLTLWRDAGEASIDAKELADLADRGSEALRLLADQLERLQWAPADENRPRQLTDAREKLEQVREIIIEPQDEPPENSLFDLRWAMSDQVMSYSRGVLWFFLAASAVAILYLIIRRLTSAKGVPADSDAETAVGGMAEAALLETPDHHRQMALEARAAQNFKMAMHHFQLMALAALDQARLVALDHGRTNWELHNQLLLRRQKRLAAVLADMNRTYDLKWYGGEPIDGAEVDDFGRLAEQLHREVGHDAI